LLGARADVRASAVVANRDGGVRIDRAPDDALPFPVSLDRADGNGDHYPSDGWPALDGLDGWAWAPPATWFPAEALELPGLEPLEGIGLRWARSELASVRLASNGDVGLRASGHAVRLTGVTAEANEGPGVVLLQTRNASIDEANASALGLSRVVDSVLRENAGAGLVVAQAGLVFREAEGEARRVFTGGRLNLEGLEVRANAGPGIVLDEAVVGLRDSTVVDNEGVGIWSAGAIASIVENEVRGTSAGALPGPDGAPIEAGDGILLQGTGRFAGTIAESVELRRNIVSRSARAGLAVVTDRFFFGGTVDFTDGVVEDNAVPGVRVGPLEDADLELRVLGVELAARDREDFALPVPPE